MKHPCIQTPGNRTVDSPVRIRAILSRGKERVSGRSAQNLEVSIIFIAITAVMLMLFVTEYICRV